MNKVKTFISAHKILSSFILLVVLLIGYWGYKKATSTAGESRYVTSRVTRGTIIASVSGTGQVTDVNQIDVKSKASGDVVYIGAKNGDKVAAGALLLEVDPTDAQKAVRDATAALTSANLSLQKLKIQNSTTNLNADLVKAYSDGFTAVSNAFLDLQTVLNGVDDVLAENNLSENSARQNDKTAEAFRAAADTAQFNAQKSFDTSSKTYSTLNINSPRGDIDSIISATYNTTRLLSTSVKKTIDYVALMANDSSDASQFSGNKASLSSYSDTINGHLSDLLAAQTNIKSNADSAQNSDIDIQSAELSVQQKENALQDAKDKLADYYIRAPLAGIVAGLDAKRSDSVSSGSVVASIVTPKQLALISLNEVDVAKIKLGQKANLTFDAIPDLTMSGSVSEIDTIGTVSQGVVTYDVKINFDTEDSRVKPSMSVSALITTDMKQDVLTVPNSAVKSRNEKQYVEMFDAPLPRPTDGLLGSISKIPPNKVPVETGLANDSITEIVSGLNEGDMVVSRTITSGATAAPAAPSLFGGTANNRGTRGN